MEVGLSIRVPVTEASQVGEARRQAARLAERLGLGPVDAGRAALVATEMAGNLVKHASEGGELLIHPLARRHARGVEMLALDRGAGIVDVGRAMQDGYSTAGSAGTGLGAVSRQSDLFQLHSGGGQGTAVLAQVWGERPSAATSDEPAVGGVCVPKQGEEVSGDAWACLRHTHATTLLVVDGLGHGPGAAEAAEAAVGVFREQGEDSPADLLLRVHDALRGTRGAAVSVARIDAAAGTLYYAGVGNISGIVLAEEKSSSLVSHNGIVGHQLRRVQEFSYPWSARSLLILHSDGLLSRWSLDRYAGLRGRHPSLVAGVVYRDFQRGSDDVTVVAASATP